jgi:murein DD-endopeptidase MepM/ murein hydrolase activator NlpD
MHEYLKKLYPKEYNRLEKDPSPEAFEALRQRARRKWFGLKDRPHVARKEFRKFNQDVPSIFPEIQPKQETETAPQSDARREQTGDRRSDGSFQYRAPVTGTVVGGRRSYFGAPRSGGRRLHSGNDFQAKNGSPVTATLNGQVVHVGNHSGYGWTIDIRHPDGNVHRYATHGVNPARFGIEKGTKVEAGQQIGTIGKGHLHYEVIDSNYYDREQKRNNGGFVSTSRVPGRNPSVFDPSKVIGVPHGTRITGGDPYKPPEQKDSTSPENEQQRRKDAIEQGTFDFRDLPSTDSQELPGVPGITLTPTTPDRMNLGASDVDIPEKPAENPYKQFKGSIDLDGKRVNFEPPQIKNDMEQFYKLLRMIEAQQAQQEQQAQQAQQAQSQSLKVLGNSTGPEFFYPGSLINPKDENTKRDNTGVNSAEPPAQKKPDLNKIYT